MNSEATSGSLFVISAPSGTGKSTVARRLLDRTPGLQWSVSFTTRPARPGEREDQDYHFIDDAEFDRMVAREAFLEWAGVHGRRYGTGLETARAALDEGHDLLLDIDVQGAQTVRGGPLRTVSVMLLPPDFDTLEQRLHGRGREERGERLARLAQARREVETYRDFDYLVINEDVDRTVEELRSIVVAERRRTARCAAEAQRILSSFPEDAPDEEKRR